MNSSMEEGQIFKYLIPLKNLREVLIVDCQIGIKQEVELSNFIDNAQSKLEAINISLNPLKNDCVKIYDSLGRSGLKRIYMQACSIDCEGIKTFAEGIDKNQNI